MNCFLQKKIFNGLYEKKVFIKPLCVQLTSHSAFSKPHSPPSTFYPSLPLSFSKPYTSLLNSDRPICIRKNLVI